MCVLLVNILLLLLLLFSYLQHRKCKISFEMTVFFTLRHVRLLFQMLICISKSLQRNPLATQAVCHSGVSAGHKKHSGCGQMVSWQRLVLEPKNMYVNFMLSLLEMIMHQANSTSVCAAHSHTEFAWGKVHWNCVHFFYKHTFKGFPISLRYSMVPVKTKYMEINRLPGKMSFSQLWNDVILNQLFSVYQNSSLG